MAAMVPELVIRLNLNGLRRVRSKSHKVSTQYKTDKYQGMKFVEVATHCKLARIYRNALKAAKSTSRILKIQGLLSDHNYLGHTHLIIPYAPMITE